MKHLFLINPAAGKFDHTAAVTEAVRSVFAGRPGDKAEIRITAGPGHCTELARAACGTGEPLRLYACGGDGTLNEAVNGAAGFANAAVTHFPCGSGNDFIRIFRDPSAFRDLSRLADGSETEFDLIRAGDRLAVNICSIGFDARIGTGIDRYRRLPLVTGPGAYALSTVINTVRGVHRHYVVVLDGHVIDGRQTLICIANGRWYGSGFYPVPEAEPDDGLLDVLLVREVSRLTVAQVIGSYKKGLYKKHPDIIRHYRCRDIRVVCDEISPVNVDGELLLARDIDFTVAPEKIRFFYPTGLLWHSQTSKIMSMMA